MIIIKKFPQIVLLSVLFSLDICASDNRIAQTQSMVLNQESLLQSRILERVLSTDSVDSIQTTSARLIVREQSFDYTTAEARISVIVENFIHKRNLISECNSVCNLLQECMGKKIECIAKCEKVLSDSTCIDNLHLVLTGVFVIGAIITFNK